MIFGVENKHKFTLNDLRDFVAKSARLSGNTPVCLADDNNIIPIIKIIGDEKSINIYLD